MGLNVCNVRIVNIGAGAKLCCLDTVIHTLDSMK